MYYTNIAYPSIKCQKTNERGKCGDCCPVVAKLAVWVSNSLKNETVSRHSSSERQNVTLFQNESIKTLTKAKRYLAPERNHIKTLSKAKRYLFQTNSLTGQYKLAWECLNTDHKQISEECCKIYCNFKRDILDLYLIPTTDYMTIDRLQHRSVVRQSLVRYNLEHHHHHHHLRSQISDLT